MFIGEGSGAGAASGEGTPAPVVELTLDQQLEALANETKDSGASASDKPGDKPGEGSSPDASQEDGPKDILGKLDEIDPQPKEGETPKEEPQLSEEQQKIFEAVPDLKTAETLYAVAEGYQNFTDALAQGKFENVEKMIEAHSPQAHEGLMEHIYQTKMTEWIDRWIAEKEAEKDGKSAPMVKGMTALQRQVKALETKLAERDTNNRQAEDSARQDGIVRAYVSHIDSLFDKIEFSPADRPWITSEIHNRVAADPKVKQAINSGNPAAVNKIFAATVREYVQRDKAVADSKTKVLQKQEQKKAPIQSGQAVDTGVSDDINQVPKDKRDSWMDNQLAKLKAKVGR